MMRGRFLIAIIAVVAFIAIAPAIFGSFTITLMNYIGIYAMATLGLVLMTGIGGLTSFGQAAFVGIGAYATAWYTVSQGGSPWIGLLLALVLTAIVAIILGVATLRLGGHFLPLSTIAWGIAIYFLFGNSETLVATTACPAFRPFTSDRFHSSAPRPFTFSFGAHLAC